MATVLVLKQSALDGVVFNPGDKAEVSGPALDNLIRKGRVQIASVKAEPVIENETAVETRKPKLSKRI